VGNPLEVIAESHQGDAAERCKLLVWRLDLEIHSSLVAGIGGEGHGPRHAKEATERAMQDRGWDRRVTGRRFSASMERNGDAEGGECEKSTKATEEAELGKAAVGKWAWVHVDLCVDKGKK
jgi:hypothetical protein